MLARAEQVVEVGEGLAGMAGRGGVDGPPDRLDPAGADHPRHVLAADHGPLADVNRELFDLRRQQADLGADQLDQEPGGVVFELRLRTHVWPVGPARPATCTLVGGLAIDRQANLLDELGQLGVTRPRLDRKHEHTGTCGLRSVYVSRSLRCAVTNGSAPSTITTRHFARNGKVRKLVEDVGEDLPDRPRTARPPGRRRRPPSAWRTMAA